uniref:MFS domain-containing protein n=1 Tax=Globodera pallida TaxID=36090 RepID=A0A183C663_GLOPA
MSTTSTHIHHHHHHQQQQQQQLRQQASDDEEKCLLTPTSQQSCCPFDDQNDKLEMVLPCSAAVSGLLPQSELLNGTAEAADCCSVAADYFFLSSPLIYSEPALPSAFTNSTMITSWAHSDMALPQGGVGSVPMPSLNDDDDEQQKHQQQHIAVSKEDGAGTATNRFGTSRAATPKSSCFFSSESQPSIGTGASVYLPHKQSFSIGEIRDTHMQIQKRYRPSRRRHYTDPVDFEGILNIIGGCSWWQIWVYLLISLQQIPHAMFNLSVVYMMYQPDHWCKVPGLNASYSSNSSSPNVYQWDVADTLQGSVVYPRTRNKQRDVLNFHSQCHYYDRGEQRYDQLRRMPLDEAQRTLNDSEESADIRKCTEWFYDQDVMGSTIVTEWNLVCDDNFKRAHAHLFYSFGFLFGCLLGGFASDRFGRKPTVIGFGILSSMFGLLLPYATYFPMFLFIRFCGAVCNEAADLAAYVLCMEITGTRYRAMVGSLLQAPWAVGYATLALIAYFCNSWQNIQSQGTHKKLGVVNVSEWKSEQRYDQLRRMPLDEAQRTLNDSEESADIRKCTEWFYDQDVMGSTIVTEWNLVCDDNFKRAHAHLFYSFGFLFGCLLGGFASDRFGRKPTVIGFGILSSMFGLLLPYATYFPMFLFIRFCGAVCNEVVQPDHWCKVPGLNASYSSNSSSPNVYQWDVADTLQGSVVYPRTRNKQRDVLNFHSQCHYYDRGEQRYDQLRRMPLDEAQRTLNDSEESADIRKCTEWFYDQDVMGSTIVTEWNLVCDDNFKRAHAHLFYSFGFLFGCLLGGFASDRFGRKPTVIGFGILSSMFGLLLPYATYFPMFLFIRFCGAVCNEAADLAAYVLCMEITGTRYRAMVGSLLQAPWAVGYATLALIAYFCNSWQNIQLITAALHTLSICLICVLPESPRWLIVNNRVDEAERYIRKACREPPFPFNLFKFNKSSLPCDLELVKHAEQRKWVRRDQRANILHLLKSRALCMRTGVICVVWIATALVYYGLIIALSDQSAPGRVLFSGNFFLNNAVAGAIELPTLIFCVYLMKYGRKRSQIFTLVAAAIFILLAMASMSANRSMLSLGLMLLAKIFIQGGFNILYIFTSELYPTVIRNSAVGFCSMIARFGSGVSSYIAILSDVTLSIVPMIIFATFSLFAGTLVMLLPETRDQPLPDTLQDAVTILKDTERPYQCRGFGSKFLGGTYSVSATELMQQQQQQLQEEDDDENENGGSKTVHHRSVVVGGSSTCGCDEADADDDEDGGDGSTVGTGTGSSSPSPAAAGQRTPRKRSDTGGTAGGIEPNLPSIPEEDSCRDSQQRRRLTTTTTTSTSSSTAAAEEGAVLGVATNSTDETTSSPSVLLSSLSSSSSAAAAAGMEEDENKGNMNDEADEEQAVRDADVLLPIVRVRHRAGQAVHDQQQQQCLNLPTQFDTAQTNMLHATKKDDVPRVAASIFKHIKKTSLELNRVHNSLVLICPDCSIMVDQQRPSCSCPSLVVVVPALFVVVVFELFVVVVFELFVVVVLASTRELKRSIAGRGGGDDVTAAVSAHANSVQSTHGGLVAAGALRKDGVTELDAAPPKPQRALATTTSSWSMECSVLLTIQFFERLSFYTMKGILLPLFVGTLHVNEASAKAFILLCVGVTVLAPIVGAAMADAKNGNYGVLASMFPLYLAGQLLFTVGPNIPGLQFLHPGLEMFALFFLVYMCGGIRAVLAAYGADQIVPPNAAQIGRFFALYYAAEQYAIILAVTVIIPKLQGIAPWPLPSDQPFLSVLGAATALLLLAFVTLVGTNRLFRKRVPSGQNVFSRCYGTIKTALHNKKRYKQRRLVVAKSRSQQISPPKNMLDHFLDDHNCERDKECDFGRKNVCGQVKFLEELRVVLRMMLLFVPLPLFWAYQSQMFSLWAVQKMNVDPCFPIIGAFLLPDQIGLLLNIFVIILIPVLYYLVYPSSLAQLLSMNTYLKRMASGMFLCALACAMSASVQFWLNKSVSPPLQPPPNGALLKVFNIFPYDCAISVIRAGDNGTGTGLDISIAGNGTSNDVPFTLTPGEVSNGYTELLFKFGAGSSCAGHRKSKIRMEVKVGKLHYAIVSPQGIMSSAMDVLKPFPAAGQASIGVVIMMPCNSLDQQLLPAECANATLNMLAQALTPFASPFAICPFAPSSDDVTASATNSTESSTNSSASSSTLSTPSDDNNASSSSSCIMWDFGDIQSGQLSVFPPRGDNLGPGSASIYALKTVPGGMYTVPPQQSASSSDDDGSNSSSTPASIWDSGIQLDGNGGVSLIVLSLDGSPLNGASPNAPIALKATMISYWFLMIYIGWSLVPLFARFQLSPDPMVQLLLAACSMSMAGALFAWLAHCCYTYKDRLGGTSSDDEPRRKSATAAQSEDTGGGGGGLTEMFSHLRASIARLPKRRVARL